MEKAQEHKQFLYWGLYPSRQIDLVEKLKPILSPLLFLPSLLGPASSLFSPENLPGPSQPQATASPHRDPPGDRWAAQHSSWTGLLCVCITLWEQVVSPLSLLCAMP